MRCRKTDDAKALLTLKNWLKKQGRQNAEWLLSQALPDDAPPVVVDIGIKQTIARVMISCIEDYGLADLWRGYDGYYFVEYIEGLDDFGTELDEDDDYAAPVKVRHPDGDFREEWDDHHSDAVLDYLFGNGILLIDDQIYASNTRVSHQCKEMEAKRAPYFPVLNELVAKAQRELDEGCRFLTERCLARGKRADK
jgi:hypothetical protein